MYPRTDSNRARVGTPNCVIKCAVGDDLAGLRLRVVGVCSVQAQGDKKQGKPKEAFLVFSLLGFMTFEILGVFSDWDKCFARFRKFTMLLMSVRCRIMSVWQLFQSLRFKMASSVWVNWQSRMASPFGLCWWRRGDGARL